MNKTDSNPRLEDRMRRAYRSGTVSPYLSQRVVAIVNSRKWKARPGLKLAGGFLCAAALVIILTTYEENSHIDSAPIEVTVSNSIQLPSIAMPEYPDANLNIPSLASLGKVPTLNRFNTPAVSLVNPGDFCIYQSTGELSC